MSVTKKSTASKKKARVSATNAPQTRKSKTASKAATEATGAKPARDTRKGAVVALVSRKAGASLNELMTATGWQAHSIRGLIATLGKKGMTITSSRNDAGERIYRHN